MKKIFLVITTLLVGGMALAHQMGALNFDFIAPSVPGTSAAPNQVGLIVYDTTAGGFFGRTAGSSPDWVPLGSATTGYEEVKSDLVDYSTLCTNDVWCDLDSISLAAGEWDVTGQAVYYSNGTTATGEINLGISTTPGNTNSGMTIGHDHVIHTKDNSGGIFDTLNIVPYRVTPSTSTTYYIKSDAATDVTNLQIAYRISARRVK